MGRFQTVVTAVIANRQLMDGIGLQIQEPNLCKEEVEYLKATVQAGTTRWSRRSRACWNYSILWHIGARTKNARKLSASWWSNEKGKESFPKRTMRLIMAYSP
jgi:hypothetical protein